MGGLCHHSVGDKGRWFVLLHVKTFGRQTIWTMHLMQKVWLNCTTFYFGKLRMWPCHVSHFRNILGERGPEQSTTSGCSPFQRQIKQSSCTRTWKTGNCLLAHGVEFENLISDIWNINVIYMQMSWFSIIIIN